MGDEIFEEYTRVTDALKFLSGLSKVPEQVLKNASERGTRVHLICDALMEGIDTTKEETSDIQGYIDGFNTWQIGKKFVSKPSRFFCDEHKITGEIDGLYENETGLTLFDFKTSSKPGKTWPLQGSAYSYLAKQYGLNITKIEFVHLFKNGKEPKSYFYEENFSKYLFCLEIHREFFVNETCEIDLEHL